MLVLVTGVLYGGQKTHPFRVFQNILVLIKSLDTTIITSENLSGSFFSTTFLAFVRHLDVI